ncbi:hypothetical protein [uncultured Methanobrevibacter sp.]|uniref:hypothetical protein n=1 Tax=uncultured Methanobrevibacter sp. TaxID=253161 RepID=UPI0025EE6B61|nr:hypothetical protein [uncultured Methanobrevibacter sp.]
METNKYGTGLFVTDQFVENVDMLQINVDEIDKAQGNFDFIIINLNKGLVDKNADERVKIILEIFSKVRTGGIIFIPENTYQILYTGRRGMEALIEILGYKIELPPYNVKDIIIASKP